MALTVPAFFVLGLSAGSWHLWNYSLGVMTSCSLDNLLFSRRTRALSLFSSSGFHHLFFVPALGFLTHCLHSPGSLGPLHLESLWGQFYEAPPSTPRSHDPGRVSPSPLAKCVLSQEPCSMAGDGASKILFPWPLPSGCRPPPQALLLTRHPRFPVLVHGNPSFPTGDQKSLNHP